MMSGSANSGGMPLAAVSGAIFHREDVLLVQRAKAPALGLWSLPGGHIEPGETAADALSRELTEETGIQAQIRGVADGVDVIRTDERGLVTFHRVILVFYGIWLSGEPRAGSDVSAAVWRHKDDIAPLPATQGLAQVVERAWLRYKSDAVSL